MNNCKHWTFLEDDGAIRQFCKAKGIVCFCSGKMWGCSDLELYSIEATKKHIPSELAMSVFVRQIKECIEEDGVETTFKRIEQFDNVEDRVLLRNAFNKAMEQLKKEE